MSKNRKEHDKTYEEKRAGQRTRNWTVILYPDDLPKNWIQIVDDLNFKWIQSPIHDKDINADGEPKKAHYHALFMFGSVKTQEQVEMLLKQVLGESNSGSIIGVATPKQVTDRCSIVRYMAHLDNPDKASYNISDIVGHNGADPVEILKFSATETREMIIAMEEYIEDNHIIEIADFSKEIRYEHPEWHTIVTTKMTVYFSAFIRSCRHKKEQSTRVVLVNENGEIIEK